jgi:hypothetical protein
MQDFFFDIVDPRTGVDVKLKVRANSQAEADERCKRVATVMGKRPVVRGFYVSPTHGIHQ